MIQYDSMQRVIITLLFLAVASLTVGAQQSFAAKKFVKKPAAATVKTSGGGSIPAIVRKRGDARGILISFSHFNGLQSVSYSFTYTTGGLQQGAGGQVTSANNPTSQRELLFGTCSGGVCKYHTGVKNARLVLTATFTNGRKVSKSYVVKTNL